MVYVVTYDLLNSPKREYARLYKELKNSLGWWHYLDSTWLISTDESSRDLYKRLAPVINDNDSILIIEAGKNRQGWLPEEAWDWMRAHI